MEKDSSYLFVYGTLRKDFQHFAHKYVSSYFVFISYAAVKGKLYNLEYFPAAVKTESESYIKGELYQLQNEDYFSKAFKELDDYEGADAGADENPLFNREITEVKFGDKIVRGWIYWYNKSISEHASIVSGDILDNQKPLKII